MVPHAAARTARSPRAIVPAALVAVWFLDACAPERPVPAVRRGAPEVSAADREAHPAPEAPADGPEEARGPEVPLARRGPVAADEGRDPRVRKFHTIWRDPYTGRIEEVYGYEVLLQRYRAAAKPLPEGFEAKRERLVRGVEGDERAGGRIGDAEAVRILRDALESREREFGPESPYVADTLVHLALVYWRMARAAEADPLFARALAIRASTPGVNRRVYADNLESYARLLDGMGESERAADVRRRLKQVRESGSGGE